jgi:hypothetical protein
MFGIRHPFDQSLYEVDDHGEVLITKRDGRAGRYHRDGSYIEGERFDVDPQLCNWVGGPRAQHRLQSEPKIS